MIRGKCYWFSGWGPGLLNILHYLGQSYVTENWPFLMPPPWGRNTELESWCRQCLEALERKESRLILSLVMLVFRVTRSPRLFVGARNVDDDVKSPDFLKKHCVCLTKHICGPDLVLWLPVCNLVLGKDTVPVSMKRAYRSSSSSCRMDQPTFTT